jgi:virulence factor Mce-like protein
MSRRSLLTVVAVAALFVLGVSYVLVAVVRIDPFHRPMTVTVDLARTGGLLTTSPVTYRGYPVGAVRAISLRPGGVRVTTEVDQGTRIPADTEVVVANLSAAGEEYLDFRPRVDHGPYLANGSRIDARDTRTPIPFPKVVADVTGLAAQIEPKQVTVVIDELQRAFGDSAPDIQRIIDGGDFLLAGLDKALPNTVSALRNGRIVLGTVSDLRGELVRFSGDARDFSATLRRADRTAREVLDESPDTLRLLDHVIRKDGPSVTALLADLATSAHVVALRTPAISRFLPELTTLGPAAAAAVRGDKIQVIVDLYPRPTCDYGTPRRSPAIGGSPPPRIYRYCTQTGPRLQQRGSTNVPRPPGDDTARPPKGADPEQRSAKPENTAGR